MTTNLMRKFISIGKQSIWWRRQSLKILSFAGKANFITGNKYCQLLSLKEQAHFVQFWENACQVLKIE